ncbi:MAG: hypothetical protein GTO45_02530 [Candidatus Aminicenantes bacterium]|nr:hypothetical protein [Candidatus Aminicenantes bacterium]NIM77606.1 hypothetical protein [Candidatus Aminicenantes bacterium]NIN16920.1 hypothetical protein [Candidatus Aminicenantes bacterium]NIN40813.1 hypothetical protein [Candidatus Aminicenantes bacterium]NIN83617.1 hypothetical protein [Candidatus Aminicenantes bacterium]
MPDDIFLVSYPKSGNTWARFLICNYLTGGKCDFLKVFDMIPDLHMNPELSLKYVKPRIFKSHLPYQPNYKNVIYLARDGRDVAVSYYFQYIKHKRIDRNTLFSEFLNEFNSGNLPFGLWSTHVTSWLNHKTERFLVIRFEDMLIDPKKELEKILQHLGIEIIPQKLDIAVDASSFDKMFKLEHEQHFLVPSLANSNPDIHFVRKGISGDYLNYFDDSLETQFIEIHFEGMKCLGYI